MIDRAWWETLLRTWSQEILVADEYHDQLPPHVVATDWLGYPGATEAEIQQAETRLGTTLPPSYRTFLGVTNGWRMTTSFINQVWSTDEITWFAERNPRWVESYNASRRPARLPSVPDADYFVYGDQQDPVLMRDEYLLTALQISEEGDSAVYLLNPQVTTPDGEWEAWFLANWLPGANRYRSFWELMQAEHAEFLRLR